MRPEMLNQRRRPLNIGAARFLPSAAGLGLVGGESGLTFRASVLWPPSDRRLHAIEAERQSRRHIYGEAVSTRTRILGTPWRTARKRQLTATMSSLLPLAIF